MFEIALGLCVAFFFASRRAKRERSRELEREGMSAHASDPDFLRSNLKAEARSTLPVILGSLAVIALCAMAMSFIGA